MDIELTRPKNIIYIHIVLVAFLLLALFVGEWFIDNNYDHTIRYGGLKGLRLITLAVLPIGFIKILFDVYFVYNKTPLLLLRNNNIEIKNIFIKNTIIPVSSIDSIKIKNGSNASNIAINIKKSLFKNTTKKIYEITFTKEAENYLKKNNVKYFINHLR